MEREFSLNLLRDAERKFLTLGGAETFLIFLQEFPLHNFCAFELFQDEKAFSMFEREFLRPTADAALQHGCGLILDCLVWHASKDYIRGLGGSVHDVPQVNHQAARRMRRFVDEWRQDVGTRGAAVPLLLAAEIGPRGDGYHVTFDGGVESQDAPRYHETQVAALAESDIDLLWALTMTHAGEAAGIAKDAQRHALPIIVSATVDQMGRLPDGTSLGEFVESVDGQTGGYPLFYMVNCAHPAHLRPTLLRAQDEGAQWLTRFRGMRANASKKSHAELDNSSVLDEGEPGQFAQELTSLAQEFSLHVLGGCCGTDARHIACLAEELSGGGARMNLRTSTFPPAMHEAS